MTGFDDSDPIGKRDRIGRFCATSTMNSTLPARMKSTTRVEVRNGRAIPLTVPAGGFVIYA